mgnify:CR=1 FL=1
MSVWFNPAREIDALLRKAAASVPGLEGDFNPELKPSDPRHADFQANGILAAAKMTAHDYIALLANRASLQKRVSAVTQNYDAVIMPTCAIVAPTLDEVSTVDGFTRKNMLLLRNTAVGNFLDRCGISLPCHAAGELPVGFMLMGETMADQRVLAMARSVAPAVRAH